MKVAIVLRTLNKSNGAARVVLQQAESFLSKGHNVHIFTEKISSENRSQTQAHIHTITTWPLSGKWARQYFEYRTEKLIKKIQFDLVIAHGDLQNEDVLFVHNCVHLQRELVAQEVGHAETPLEQRHRRMIAQGPYKLLIANSQLMKNDFVQRFHIPENKIIISYPSLDPKKFTPRTITAREQRKKMGLPDVPFLFGLITSGEPEIRGADLLIQAYLSLPENVRRQSKLLIMGKNMQKKLQHLVPQTEAPQVLFFEALPGVAEYYKALDVFVLPARIETFGLTVIEACACGVPAILSTNVGALEVLPPQLKALAVPPHDITTLARRLMDAWALSQQPGGLSQLGQIAAATATSNSEFARFSELELRLKKHNII
jgi:UDP-glucose:(heptosyl)LPS alpha-1,3-glucosyltransferase